MKQYKALVERILHEGASKDDRTGTGTLSVFGHQMRFNLADGFPLVTVKRTFWKGAFTEMLWMLRGDTNTEWLHEHGVHIWDEWADWHGELGPIYGAQWRNWQSSEFPYYLDQMQVLIDGLKYEPYSRRHIMSAWSPEHLPMEGLPPSEQAKHFRQALAPCHCLVQFDVTSGRLSCQVYQRSCDVFLGNPFNIAGYALLTHLLAHHLGYEVGDLIWTGGDCHLYSNHIPQAVEMLRRSPKKLSTLIMHHEPERPLWEIEPAEIAIRGYEPHDAIKAPVAV